ncbi:MAG: hypothetical protein HWE25_01840 [Alphaproteobacteria bacterium]|nr:hypothetical protein [Alphaproteobacteria bacterium]
MKTIYFHIGTPKTGTTALQVFLAKNEDALEKQGVRYLPIGPRRNRQSPKMDQGNAQPLARSLLPAGTPYNLRQNQKALMAEFKSALDNCGEQIPIISGEAFCELPLETLKSLVQNMNAAGFEPKILVWVREHAAYLESRYNQFVKKRMETDDFETFVKKMCADHPYLAYGRFADQLAEMVGSENVLVRAFGERDTCEEFADIVGLDMSELEKPQKGINVSLSPAKTEILRALNNLGRPQSFANALMQNEKILSQLEPSQASTFVSPGIREKLDNLYSEDLQHLSEKWFDGKPILPQKTKPYVKQAEVLDQLDPLELIQFLGGILVRNEERLTTIERTLAAVAARLKKP